MTHTEDEALRMALESLEIAEKHLAYVEIFEAITAINQALAAPESEKKHD